MQAAYVVSDLHMFCKRSQWEAHLPAIRTAAQEADLFVFNGDTVDFKWSSLPSEAATVRAAIAFFRGFAEASPRCQVHVNLGNHDYVHGFIIALDQLSREVRNFSWHPYYLRVGRNMFLHGDVANRKMDHRKLKRFRAGWSHHRQQGRFRNRVYDAAFRAKAHVAVSRLVFPHKRTLRRVLAYLEDIGHCPKSGVERVFFGHTHVPVSGIHYNGATFHNGGAPMAGMPFDLVKVQL